MRHNGKTHHMLPTFLFTLDLIIIPPISYVFPKPPREMLQYSDVHEIEFDTIIQIIAHDLFL